MTGSLLLPFSLFYLETDNFLLDTIQDGVYKFLT